MNPDNAPNTFRRGKSISVSVFQAINDGRIELFFENPYLCSELAENDETDIRVTLAFEVVQLVLKSIGLGEIWPRKRNLCHFLALRMG